MSPFYRINIWTDKLLHKYFCNTHCVYYTAPTHYKRTHSNVSDQLKLLICCHINLYLESVGRAASVTLVYYTSLNNIKCISANFSDSVTQCYSASVGRATISNILAANLSISSHCLHWNIKGIDSDVQMHTNQIMQNIKLHQASVGGVTTSDISAANFSLSSQRGTLMLAGTLEQIHHICQIQIQIHHICQILLNHN